MGLFRIEPGSVFLAIVGSGATPISIFHIFSLRSGLPVFIHAQIITWGYDV